MAFRLAANGNICYLSLSYLFWALTAFKLMMMLKLAVAVQHQPLTKKDGYEISNLEKENQPSIMC